MAENPDPHLDDPLRGGPGFERRDTHVRAVFLFAAGLAALCVFALFTTSWVFDDLRDATALEQEPPHPLAIPGTLPPGPNLQANPNRDYADYARQQREGVESYGWVDPAMGIVRVPVERALELVLEEGLPTRAQEGGR